MIHLVPVLLLLNGTVMMVIVCCQYAANVFVLSQLFFASVDHVLV